MQELTSSPGVYSQEVDKSFVAPAPSVAGLCVAGPTEKGKAYVPTDVASFGQYSAVYGLGSATSYVPQTVYNYLQAGDSAKVIRVLGNGGWSFNSSKPIAAIVTGSTILAVFHPSLNNYPALASLSGSIATGSYSNFSLTLSGNQVYKQTSASLDPSNANYIVKVLGTDQNFQTGSAFPYLNFNNYYTASVTGSSAVSLVLNTGSITFTSSYSEGYAPAATPWVLSSGGVRLFRFVHNSDGFKTNRDIKIGINNISVNSDPTVFASFNVVARAWNDTDRTPTILEQYLNVSLDPNANNYIGKVIGDKYEDFDSNLQKVVEHGDFPNLSNYFRIELSDAVTNGSIQPNVAPNGYEALYETVAGFTGYSLPTASLVYSNTGSSTYSGFDYYNADNINYLNPIPLEAGAGANKAFVLPANDNKFMLPFQGGTDGMSYATIKKIGSAIDPTGVNVFGYDLSSANASGYAAYKKALDILSNKDAYRFNVIVLPGVIEQYHSTVTAYAQSLADSRKDCVYLRDLTGVNETVSTAVSTVAGLDSSYGATYYPWVKVKDIQSGKDSFMPPTVIVPQAVAYTDKVAASWFPVAGTGRGNLGGASDTRNKLSNAEIGTLYAARINPIIKKPNTGVIIWGNKTLQVATTALSSFNVRRALIEIEGYIEQVATDLVWDLNTTATRNSFVSQVNPYLENVQAKQGLYAYQVVMDDTNNSNADIDRLVLNGLIRLQPTKAIEYVYLTFEITPTGTTFS